MIDTLILPSDRELYDFVSEETTLHFRNYIGCCDAALIARSVKELLVKYIITNLTNEKSNSGTSTADHQSDSTIW
jgi:hypothetical protein